VHVLDRSAPLLLEADGQRVAEAKPRDCVEFAVSDTPAQVLRIHHQGFYEKTRRKLQLTDSSELAPP
jgi:NAD+ kinase